MEGAHDLPNHVHDLGAAIAPLLPKALALPAAAPLAAQKALAVMTTSMSNFQSSSSVDPSPPDRGS